MTGRELLDELQSQESASSSTGSTRTPPGTWASPYGRPPCRGQPVAISIRRNGQRLFHAALHGSPTDNDGWLALKSAVVDRYGRSSLRIGEQFRGEGGSFDQDS